MNKKSVFTVVVKSSKKMALEMENSNLSAILVGSNL
jgi:hypothetical protein